MATSAELFTQRATAGATYQAAVADLRTAWIALAAYDRACATGSVGGALAAGVQTFANNPEGMRTALRHPNFLLDIAAETWAAEVMAAAEAHVNGLEAA